MRFIPPVTATGRNLPTERECSVFPQRLSHSLIGQQSHQSMWPQLTADFESHAEAIADRGDGS
jgi:hypothetical protein